MLAQQNLKLKSKIKIYNFLIETFLHFILILNCASA